MDSWKRRLGDTKGSVAKSLARAQRDLDFAALMSEDAEQCAAQGDPELMALGPTPAGQAKVRDMRLRLTHTGAIIDQFLMALHEAEHARGSTAGQGRSDPATIRNRLDIWVTAGLVMEIVSDAHEVRRCRQAVDETNAFARCGHR